MKPKFELGTVIEAIRRNRGFLAPAAVELGCHRRTLHNYCKRYQTVDQARQEARETMKDVAEGKLADAVGAGEAWAICFFLKTQAKDRGFTEKAQIQHEVTSPHGVLAIPMPLSPEAWDTEAIKVQAFQEKLKADAEKDVHTLSI